MTEGSSAAQVLALRLHAAARDVIEHGAAAAALHGRKSGARDV